MDASFKRALIIVVGLNGAMFLVEMFAGFAGRSMALQADALDFFGDTLTYGISLWAIGQAASLRARAALFKAVSLAGMGIFVLASTLYRFFGSGLPNETVMGTVGVMALAANLASVLILMKWRNGDANIRSVWLCSRNDMIGNLAVLAAAGLVVATHSRLPDLVVAALMAGLFLNSARQIVTQALGELAEQRAHAVAPGE